MSTLQDAVALIKAGDRQGGQRILAQLLAQNPADEAAWLWMSSVVEDDDRREFCLKQVLKHNPEHKAALAGLAHLKESRSAASAEHAAPGAAEAPSGLAREDSRQPGAAGEQMPAPGKAAVWQAPAPPVRDPALTKTMTEFVIARLGKHDTLDNIVPKLCEVSGMSWSEAQAFVTRVEEEHRPQIASRQRPVLLVVGIISLLIGAYLAYSSASYLAAFAGTAGSVSDNPLLYILSTPQLLRRVITLVIAAAILVGGLWGTLRALLPPGSRSLLTPEAGVATGDGMSSIDDFVGVHVSLGGRAADSRRRRKG